MTTYNSPIENLFAGNRKVFWLGFVAVIGALIIGLVAAQRPFLAAGIVAVIAALICLFKWPDAATLLVIFFIYTNLGPVANRYYGVPIFLATAFPLILIIPLVWHIFWRREKVVIGPVLQLLLALCLIYTLGATFSSDITLSLTQLTEFLIEGLLLYFLITNVIRTPRMLKRAVWVLLISGAFIGGLSLYQQVTKTFDNNYGGFAQVDSNFATGVENLQGQIEQPRLAGSIGEQNRYGQIMLMLVPLGLFQLWIYRSTWVRILTLIMTALIIAGGALSFSRGAAVGFVLLILIMVFLRYVKPHQFLLLVLGAALILWVFPQYGSRLASLNVIAQLADPGSGPALAGADNAVVDRASLMLAGWTVFKDHPVFGVGPGMVKYYTESYVRQIGISSVSGTFQVHNLYLGIAAEAGLLGLVVFLLLLLIPLRDLARARKKWMVSRPGLSYLATAFFQAIVGYMVTGLFLHLSYYRFFYLMLALAVVASQLGESSTLVESEVNATGEGQLALVDSNKLLQ